MFTSVLIMFPVTLCNTRSHKKIVAYIQLSTSIYVKNGKICIFLNTYYMNFKKYVVLLPSEIVPIDFKNITIMEKTPEFLKSRTASQLANLVDKLSSDLSYIVDHLEPLTPDSDNLTVCKHDVDCLNVVTLCNSISCVVDELKSTFE